jgi:serine/threonine-protein kinase
MPVRFGRYLLDRRIAVGGSSEVFLARPASGTWPAEHLVIKRLLPAVLENPQSVGTFAMEARLHRAAQHPNVVEVYEAGSVDGEPFLAMEYVDGVDAYRLLRRSQTEQRPIPAEVAIFVAYEVCSALACVHTAVDDTGHPLAVVHRDVTPSNVYLSETGSVKLGDFGIARLLPGEQAPPDTHPDTHPLKGKYAYLSPEQVAGEDFDHRADIFSLSVMLSELLINQPLFPGSGQLAVLLAIRDGRIDLLRENAHRLPSGVMAVLEQGLARDPRDRFGSAEQFRQALEPFVCSDPKLYREALGRSVSWARNEDSPFHAPLRPGRVGIESRPPQDPRAITPVARVRTQGGQTLGPFALAKLIEMTATSRLDRADEVDMHGLGFEKLMDIPELERHVPPSTATTNQLTGPGIPDYRANLANTTMVHVFAHLLKNRETGVLFAELTRSSGAFTRKEIYLSQAKVIHVASTERSELFGEYLVRRGLIDRAELDLSLAILPRYNGRLGDTLIGLNLVDAVQIFRAIRDQGRDRITEIFTWQTGTISFYRNVSPNRVEFPLDLDLAPLMSSGLKAAVSDDQVLALHRERMDDLLIGVEEVPDTMRLAAWPPEVLKIVGAAGDGRSQRDIVGALTAARLIDVASALRAIDIACASGLLDRLETNP